MKNVVDNILKAPEKLLSRNQLKYAVRMRWRYNNFVWESITRQFVCTVPSNGLCIQCYLSKIHGIWRPVNIKMQQISQFYDILMQNMINQSEQNRWFECKMEFFFVNGKCHVTHNKTADFDLMYLQLNMIPVKSKWNISNNLLAFKGIYFRNWIWNYWYCGS